MDLAHVRAGAGPPPLVLLHGLLGSARNLSTLSRLVVERRPDLATVSFDLGGHGASPPLPPGADTATLAAGVLASVRALGLLMPLAVVGHSLGGRVALRVAQLEPSAISAVTLLDVSPGRFQSAGEVGGVLEILQRAPETFADRGGARAYLVTEGLTPALADWLLMNLDSDAGGYRWRVDRRALADLHARMATEDLWPVVEQPRAWTLRCVRGGASRYVSDADARRLEAAGCAVMTIAGAGHFLHAEQPGAVADAVVAALEA